MSASRFVTRKFVVRILTIVSLLWAMSCKDPFIADVKLRTSRFLVVEGYVNVGPEAVTTIKVTRTVPINSAESPSGEEGAFVQIEDDQNNVYNLQEGVEGFYTSDTLALPLDRQYRIRIQTGDGQSFVSTFTTPIETPAIDSVYWTRTEEGVDIYVSTHEETETTKFYQWEYEEIWENRSPYLSFYRYSNKEFFLRDEAEILAMHRCWKRDTPSGFILESLAGVSSTAITKELIAIPSISDKLSEKYSVLVSQHLLSVDHYNYLQVMIKNTNQVGSFYDPQPSQLLGNIASQGSSEPVVGYVGVYTTSSQRLNIRKADVRPWGFDLGCTQISVMLSEPDSLVKYFEVLGYSPLTVDEARVNMFAAKPACADCRRRGGNNDEPDFWEEIF